MGEKFKVIIKIIYKGILEILYPKNDKCIICGEEAEEICEKCRKSIVRCSEEEKCVGFYKGVLKELILKFKYEKDFNAGDILVELLEEKLNLYDKDCYLTFIPSSRLSLKTRGFNQCEYLAKEIAFKNDYKVINTLKKVKDTKVQKTLNSAERRRNLVGAFEAVNGKDIYGKKFVVIDDVTTTGATLKEAERVLRKWGALQINTLTIAKTYI